MRIDTSAILRSVLLAFLLLGIAGSAGAYSLQNAKDDVANLRFEKAREKLSVLAEESTGDEKQEMLLLLARLERSSSDAEALYTQVIAIDSGNRSAKEAALELAKIKFVAGDYDQALNTLRDSGACEEFEEAC
jgi:thioredoxin-like negative regulator of GroEL